jgi:hypothetical protein
MIIIACVDQNNGIAFNHRRQSQDAAIYKDILQIVDGHRLWITPYSVSLFQPHIMPTSIGYHICPVADPLHMASDGEFVFLDADMPDTKTILDAHPEAFIIYHWNRFYPADRKLNVDDFIRQTKEHHPCVYGTYELQGDSHDQITREITFLRTQTEDPNET